MPIKTKKKLPNADIKDKENTLDYAAIGKDQYNLAFICALGDPSRLEKGKRKDSDTGKMTSKVVGAKFQVLARMQIPVSPPQEDFWKNLMSYDKDNITWEWHEAGDIVLMTPFEYGLLLSQPSFNGYCLGGDRPVCITITTPRKDKAAMQTIAKLPRVTLRPYGTNDTYKDTTIEDVLTCTTEIVNEETGQRRKKKTINPGFEKWAPIIGRENAKRGRHAKPKSAEPTKEPNVKASNYLDMLGTFIKRDVLAPSEEEEFDDAD